MFIIPTTTGTGSEVTSFATVWDFELNKKLSFSSKSLKFKVFYNKDIVSIQPYSLLISSLFDALSHSFESVWNKKTNHLSELYSCEAISIILKVLIKIENNEELLDDDFDNLCFATYLSGSAISMTQTALCHSMSYPMTLNYNVNHGLAVGFFIASVMKFNEQYIYNKFDSVLNSFAINNINDLSILIARLFKNTGGLDLVVSKIKNISNLRSIAPSMINPERSKNNIRPVDKNSIDEIIESISDVYEII
jgi:alcohol dehydrogenase class IV